MQWTKYSSTEATAEDQKNQKTQIDFHLQLIMDSTPKTICKCLEREIIVKNENLSMERNFICCKKKGFPKERFKKPLSQSCIHSYTIMGGRRMFC